MGDGAEHAQGVGGAAHPAGRCAGAGPGSCRIGEAGFGLQLGAGAELQLGRADEQVVVLDVEDVGAGRTRSPAHRLAAVGAGQRQQVVSVGGGVMLRRPGQHVRPGGAGGRALEGGPHPAHRERVVSGTIDLIGEREHVVGLPRSGAGDQADGQQGVPHRQEADSVDDLPVADDREVVARLDGSHAP